MHSFTSDTSIWVIAPRALYLRLPLHSSPLIAPQLQHTAVQCVAAQQQHQSRSVVGGLSCLIESEACPLLPNRIEPGSCPDCSSLQCRLQQQRLQCRLQWQRLPSTSNSSFPPAIAPIYLFASLRLRCQPAASAATACQCLCSNPQYFPIQLESLKNFKLNISLTLI